MVLSLEHHPEKCTKAHLTPVCLNLYISPIKIGSKSIQFSLLCSVILFLNTNGNVEESEPVVDFERTHGCH